MSVTREIEGSPRTDQRFVAEAITETGVTLSGESKWEPLHWDQGPLRRDAEIDLRRKFKQADLLNVKVSAIRVYRETRRAETVTTTYTARKLYAEVAR